jgi:hypothetical protein
VTRPAGALLARVFFLAAALPAIAAAHSASDAYLTLTTAPLPAGSAAQPEQPKLHGQFDVALRDLDFVLELDDDGDGNITWGELKRHQAEIARYALGALRFGAGGKPCTVKPGRQMVDYHADGAYAAVFFDVDCGRSVARVSLDYGLFFAIDPSHRAILVSHAGADTATALLSPQNARIELDLQPNAAAK